MADAMAPRGPDGAGVVARDRVAFGHRRLLWLMERQRGRCHQNSGRTGHLGRRWRFLTECGERTAQGSN